ncbi:nuclease-related domain-containing protein [Neobacillus sp. PS3-12]|jgi:hypothetical protein|uniref:nuclease-related domain-containing protein n=1 Tax=Neobacillus sp. PS3-12 TaxID=3070677 RepID=UPI0027E18151|nr:nuclease-related domain-containing protein [Neobacillus sp. PS3-12]WML54680.1 nuclease-related domain-containing protein [Neobacillus sp. PS3-12]
MIVVKSRCESEELLVFGSLHLRMGLCSSDTHYYSNLEKGYQGELAFDRMAEAHLSDDWLAINDLLLEHHNRIFQIDSVLVRNGRMFLNDVKNFDGDYMMKDGFWYTASGSEIDDPLEQLERCESRLRRLCRDLGFSFPIESRLVFVNPEFYLFQAPLNLPIIYPAHLNRYMNQLKMKSGKLTERDMKLAQKLASLHKKKSPITRVPPYTYEQLKKGLACACGCGFMKVHNREILVCSVCNRLEPVELAVLRNVEELKRLFPDLKITTFVVHDWCKIINSKKIWRILRNNFELNRNGRSSYYDQK